MGTSQSHSRHKKGHMTNIYLTDLNKKAIMDFMKEQEKLYDKTNEHFKNKVQFLCIFRSTSQVMDQFTQMRTMRSSFLRQKH